MRKISIYREHLLYRIVPKISIVSSFGKMRSGKKNTASLHYLPGIYIVYRRDEKLFPELLTRVIRFPSLADLGIPKENGSRKNVIHWRRSLVPRFFPPTRRTHFTPADSALFVSHLPSLPPFSSLYVPPLLISFCVRLSLFKFYNFTTINTPPLKNHYSSPPPSLSLFL